MTASPGDRRLMLTVANRFDAIPAMAAEIERFCEGHGVPPAVIGQVNLALDEALTNTISYAWPEGGDRQALVRLSVADSTIEAEISDDGTEFDPLAAPPPDVTAALDDRVPGGLGVHLIRTVMDAVSYRREGGRNVLTMRKSFVPAVAGDGVETGPGG